jgi:hypothetical protein
MSTYINLNTKQYPLHQGDIRIEVDGIGDEFVCPEGYAEVQETSPPTITENQRWVEEAPQEVNGVWTKIFRVIDLTEAEITERNAWMAKEATAKTEFENSNYTPA